MVTQVDLVHLSTVICRGDLHVLRSYQDHYKTQPHWLGGPEFRLLTFTFTLLFVLHSASCHHGTLLPLPYCNDDVIVPRYCPMV
jgi:hypothetical protein